MVSGPNCVCCVFPMEHSVNLNIFVHIYKYGRDERRRWRRLNVFPCVDWHRGAKLVLCCVSVSEWIVKWCWCGNYDIIKCITATAQVNEAAHRRRHAFIVPFRILLRIARRVLWTKRCNKSARALPRFHHTRFASLCVWAHLNQIRFENSQQMHVKLKIKKDAPAHAICKFALRN